MEMNIIRTGKGRKVEEKQPKKKRTRGREWPRKQGLKSKGGTPP